MDAATEFELLCNHLASLLGVDEIDAPLRRSLTLYTQSVIARERSRPSQHATPVVEVEAIGHFRNDTTLSQSVDTFAEKHDLRPTLPTQPPGVGVSYEDPPAVTGRTSRGFPRVE